MKHVFKLMSFVLTILSFVTGATSGVMMANASELPDAGVTHGGEHTSGADGIATETQGREDDPELYTKHIDKLITKIRPMATPIDQISRYAKS